MKLNTVKISFILFSLSMGVFFIGFRQGLKIQDKKEASISQVTVTNTVTNMIWQIIIKLSEDKKDASIDQLITYQLYGDNLTNKFVEPFIISNSSIVPTEAWITSQFGLKPVKE